MNSIVKENKMVSSYFLFFLVHSTQTGVLFLQIQSTVIKGAGHNAWLPILLLGIMMHVLFFNDALYFEKFEYRGYHLLP